MVKTQTSPDWSASSPVFNVDDEYRTVDELYNNLRASLGSTQRSLRGVLERGRRIAERDSLVLLTRFDSDPRFCVSSTNNPRRDGAITVSESTTLLRP